MIQNLHFYSTGFLLSLNGFHWFARSIEPSSFPVNATWETWFFLECEPEGWDGGLVGHDPPDDFVRSDRGDSERTLAAVEGV